PVVATTSADLGAFATTSRGTVSASAFAGSKSGAAYVDSKCNTPDKICGLIDFLLRNCITPGYYFPYLSPPNLFTTQWRKLPAMPTGPAHIPSVGDIAVRGCGIISNLTQSADKAEIFLTTASPHGLAGSWCEITPMLHSRVYPAAEFFNGNVISPVDRSDQRLLFNSFDDLFYGNLFFMLP
ncbi:unnamed protein product, partial [Rodentolepis nana]|uniref:COesterase domain-containing protein n=1 Tax=Rodentolepis nana TaxID=102285 RepID=A0A0R3THH7_RODNA